MKVCKSGALRLNWCIAQAPATFARSTSVSAAEFVAAKGAEPPGNARRMDDPAERYGCCGGLCQRRERAV